MALALAQFKGESMKRTALLLITDGQTGRDWARGCLDGWAGPAGVEVVPATVAQATGKDETVFAQASVVWLVMDQPEPGVVFELIGRAQDRSLAMMLTRRDEAQPAGAMHEEGVVLCGPGTERDVVRGMLGALLSQAPVLEDLAGELRVAGVQQTGLCDQIGKMDEELRLASQLQREFLPSHLPSTGEVAFHALWRPASYVSGDIYDVVRLDERHIGFFIADAVGHGVPAALMTMFIKRSLRTKEVDTKAENGYRLLEPSEALARLNKDMVERQSEQVRFATACYGLIDCQRLEVCFARAGHPYPMLLRADGRTESLEPEGGLLGVFPDETFEQTCLSLTAGDRLLLYSDGFEVAFPSVGEAETGAKRHLSTMRYAEEFLDLRHGPVEAALSRLGDKLDAQAGSLNQRDDLTVVCVAVGAKHANGAEVDEAVMAAAG